MRMKQGRRRGSLMLLPILLLLGFGTQASGNQSLEEEAQSLVQGLYFDGLPYDKAHGLGPEAVPYLLPVLEDEGQLRYWVNTVVALGFIESSEALLPLISFLEGATDEVHVETFLALLAVPHAIGGIADSGDEDAQQYLASLLAWDEGKDLSWTFRGKNIDLVIAQHAAIGLALSGRSGNP